MPTGRTSGHLTANSGATSFVTVTVTRRLRQARGTALKSSRLTSLPWRLLPLAFGGTLAPSAFITHRCVRVGGGGFRRRWSGRTYSLPPTAPFTQAPPTCAPRLLPTTPGFPSTLTWRPGCSGASPATPTPGGGRPHCRVEQRGSWCPPRTVPPSLRRRTKWVSASHTRQPHKWPTTFAHATTGRCSNRMWRRWWPPAAGVLLLPYWRLLHDPMGRGTRKGSDGRPPTRCRPSNRRPPRAPQPWRCQPWLRPLPCPLSARRGQRR